MEADANLWPLPDGVLEACTKMAAKEEYNGCEDGNPPVGALDARCMSMQGALSPAGADSDRPPS